MLFNFHKGNPTDDYKTTDDFGKDFVRFFYKKNKNLNDEKTLIIIREIDIDVEQDIIPVDADRTPELKRIPFIDIYTEICKKTHDDKGERIPFFDKIMSDTYRPARIFRDGVPTNDVVSVKWAGLEMYHCWSGELPIPTSYRHDRLEERLDSALVHGDKALEDMKKEIDEYEQEEASGSHS